MKSLVKKDLSYTTHSDSSNSNKMNFLD
jgi:hypothetical protein